jgi:hypothetical protein
MGTSTAVRQSRFSPAAPLLALALLLSASPSFSASALSLDVAVQGITRSQPPRLLGDVVLFSYKPTTLVRFVGARFANENYAILHDYSRNENGVFALDYPLTEGLRELRYRIVVDGLWMNDPANPNTEVDAMGNLISVYALETLPSFPVLNPEIEPDGGVTFEFRASPGQRVSIMGDFNDWNPYADPLTEVRPGVFRITLRALRGGHSYMFFLSGRKTLDPFNSESGTDPDGNPVSFFSVP